MCENNLLFNLKAAAGVCLAADEEARNFIENLKEAAGCVVIESLPEEFKKYSLKFTNLIKALRLLRKKKCNLTYEEKELIREYLTDPIHKFTINLRAKEQLEKIAQTM